MQKKCLVTSKKIMWVEGKVYTEKETTRKLLGQATKSEKLQKLQLESFFLLLLLFEIVFIIFYTGTFQFPPEKTSPPPKVPTPTQNPRPDLSLSYTKREGGMRIVMIVLSSLIWSSYSNLVQLFIEFVHQISLKLFN